MDLPIEFINKMKCLLGTDADKFFDELEKPSVKGITVNFDRMNRSNFEKFCDFDHSPIEQIENGFYVDNFKFATHILNHLGVIYSQEPSAMYPVEMLDIEDNDIVLDVCAAPGGKSIQILEKLHNTGLLVSNEIVFNRSKVLYENLSRMGFKNFAITCNSPEDYQNTDLKFDKILVDAPCGGEGMLRKKDFDLNVYNPNAIETNAKRQLSILNSIKDLLKVGGRLVYSTCTYDTRENEEVVAEFLRANPEFKIIKYDRFDTIAKNGIKIDSFNTDYSFRRYPHLHQGEGQFMIALEKIGEDDDNTTTKFRAKNFEELHKKELLEINKFLEQNTSLNKCQFVKRNDSVFLLPDTTINFENLNLIHIGCMIGTIQKNVFKPHHNFYHTCGQVFKNIIELSDNQLQKFLHGEELEILAPDGMYVVSFHNTALSGGKLKNNKLKNNYPKELRI